MFLAVTSRLWNWILKMPDIAVPMLVVSYSTLLVSQAYLVLRKKFENALPKVRTKNRNMSIFIGIGADCTNDWSRENTAWKKEIRVSSTALPVSTTTPTISVIAVIINPIMSGATINQFLLGTKNGIATTTIMMSMMKYRK